MINTKDYWANIYKNSLLQNAPENDIIKLLIEKYFKNGKGTCIEVGCFPGRYLSVFGKLGYKVSGIDFYEGIDNVFSEWLTSQGLKVGKIINDDFQLYNSEIKYDVVCSFGFIEHFTNWDEILLKHLELINEDGYLLITTPNFKGFIQRFLHFIFDYDNYKNHNILSMNPGRWKEILESKNYNIIDYGYLGGFDFWYEKKERNFIISSLLYYIMKFSFLLKNIKTSQCYSPFCFIIAKKGKI
jgi:L-malate glycosyltransferase